MKEIDFDRAALLLEVIAKVTNIGPMNQPILGEAQEELKGIVADYESNRHERADKIRQEEQVAAQKALAAADDANATDTTAGDSKPDPKPAPTLAERKI